MKHRPTNGFGPALDDLDRSMEDLARLLGRATADQLRNARPVAEPILGRIDRFLSELVGGKGNDLVMSAQKFAASFMDTPEGYERYKCVVAPRWIVDLSREVADVCGLATPAVKLFRRVRFDEAADFRDLVGLPGKCSRKYKEIYIRDGLSKYETAITIGHEIYHLYEQANGLTTNEAHAERYGLQVAESNYGYA